MLTAAGGLLLAYFRGELIPAVLGDPDMVRLASPGGQEDFRLGLCLYDLEEIRQGGPGAAVRLGAEEYRRPALALALRFFAFANRKAAFRSMGAEDELVLLEAAMRSVHGAPELPWGGGALRVGLDPVARDRRTALWQSLGAPLQPAVYFSVEPVPIPGGRLRRAPAVREVEVPVRRKTS